MSIGLQHQFVCVLQRSCIVASAAAVVSVIVFSNNVLCWYHLYYLSHILLSHQLVA